MFLETQNLDVLDPFSNDVDSSRGGGSSSGSLIHIRNQQRNGRKSVTTVQGLLELDSRLDLKKMVRALKKEYSCNGTVIEDQEHGPIVQLQGDKRLSVKEFLEREGICSNDQIRVHGA